MDRVPFAAPVLVIAPHPDDESLGCGGLLATMWAAGRPAHVLCLTDGAASHLASALWPPARLAARRRTELAAAIEELGGDPGADMTWLGWADADLHRVHGPAQDLAAAMTAVADRVGAKTLVAPSPHDPHCDHVAAAMAARAVARTTGTDLVFYPVWSRWLAPRRDAPLAGARRITVPTEAAVDRKRAAIDAHASQAAGGVPDDPAGFAMPNGFAAYFAAAPEIYDLADRRGEDAA